MDRVVPALLALEFSLDRLMIEAWQDENDYSPDAGAGAA